MARERTTRRIVLLGALLALVAGQLTASTAAGADALDPDRPGARPELCPGGVLAPHDPIVIDTEDDFTEANGVTGGSGTPEDPYVISCWSIDVPQGGIGVRVNPEAVGQSLVIRDIAVTGPGQQVTGTGVQVTGSSAVSSDATVEHVTATDLFRCFQTGGVVGSLSVASNLGIECRLGITGPGSPNMVVAGNEISGVSGTGGQCIGQTAAGVVVRGNTCRGHTDAIQVGGAGTEVSGNVVEGASVRGLIIGGGTHAFDNVSRGNGVGFDLVDPLSLDGSILLEHNRAEGNTSAGILMTVSRNAVVRDNTIVGNGSAGIQFGASGNFFPTTPGNNLIENNRIGWNPYGIVFTFAHGVNPNNAEGNTIQGTEWLDGHPSYIRWTDLNTIVDAGSNYRGAAGEPTWFHDYVATVTLGDRGAAAITGASWDFGDGSSQAILPDALAGHATPPEVKHTYTAPGTYTATLTVDAVNTSGEQVTYSDTTEVTIVDASAAQTGLLSQPAGHQAWPDLANGPHRTFFNGDAEITSENVAQLVPKWRFPTTEPVTASPAVATVDVDGTATKVVYAGTYSGAFQAIRASNGLPLWGPVCLGNTSSAPAPVCDLPTPGNENRQTAYGSIVAAPAVGTASDGSSLVYVGVTATKAQLVALDAVTGDERWRFTAASTPRDPVREGSMTYSISGSPVVVGNKVLFTMDCNNKCDHGNGVFAVDASDGHLLWFFDLAAGEAVRPTTPTTEFDPPTPKPAGDCASVWSSPAVDAELGLVFFGSADCTQVPMGPYDEAVVALDLDSGDPVWTFQPRQIDQRDQDFGATPNLFKIGDRHVVGAGGKDGVYYALDGLTGEEIWSTKLAIGGNFGGFYGTVTDGERIYLTNAIGEATASGMAGGDERKFNGINFALDARTGNLLWRNSLGSGSVGQNSGTPGVYFTGGLDHQVHAFDAATGLPLTTLPVSGAVSSVPVVAGGELFVGTGTGATYRAAVGESDPLFGAAPNLPHPLPITELAQGIFAFCLASDPSCLTRAETGEGRIATSLAYDGDTEGDYHDEVTLSATLTEEDGGAPVAGKTVDFSLAATHTCSGETDAEGQASCTVVPDVQPGEYTVTASFAGDATHEPSSDEAEFTVTKEQTEAAYAGPDEARIGSDTSFSGTLAEDDGAPVSGRVITITVGSGAKARSCSATTNADGEGSCTIQVTGPPGQRQVTVAFAGDEFYEPSAGTGTVRVTTGPSGPVGQAVHGAQY